MSGLISMYSITGKKTSLADPNKGSNDGGKEVRATAKRLVGRRRRLKSTLYFAYSAIVLVLIASSMFHPARAFSVGNGSLTQRKHEWISRSVTYYSTVMRKNSQMSTTSFSDAQLTMETPPKEDEVDQDFVDLATKHYYARFLVKTGKWSFAEKLYRRIIAELTSSSEDDCDHTKLAVSTLLLALHMQRTGDVKATRAVFLNFFRRVALANENDEEDHKCTCSAKVLQAYALFEMKNGHSIKSLEIIQKAIKMDENLRPVLEWKQFRDAAAGRSYTPTFHFRSPTKKSNESALRP